MLVSEKIRQVAEAEIGVAESGGANDGPRVREYQDAVQPRPYPLGDPRYAWCAAFCVWVYGKAGVDGSWVTASTHLACTNAASRGLMSTTPRSGALLCWCGTHVGILTEPVGGGSWRTIEGNSSDAVGTRTRSLEGAAILVPPEVAAEGEPVSARRRYWIQDVSPATQMEWIGPWLAKASRDRVQKRMEAELGRRLRARSFFGVVDPRTGAVVAAPDPMGPTKGGDDEMDGPPPVGEPEAPPTEPTDVPSDLAAGA